MKIKRHSHLLVFLTLTAFIMLFLFTTVKPTAIYADGPCVCGWAYDENGDRTTGVCGDLCSPSIKGKPCGNPNTTGSHDYCDTMQRAYSCEKVVKYVGLDGHPGDPDYFLCLIDETASNTNPLNAAKGSWSEVFKKCFCSTGDMVQQILNIAIYGISIIALILLAIGGIKYITAQNNPDKITEAKETLIAAVIGLILVLLCVAILQLLNTQLPPSWGINILSLP